MREAVSRAGAKRELDVESLYLLGVVEGMAYGLAREKPCEACVELLKHGAETVVRLLEERRKRSVS
jgi:hypothetical protein